MGYRITYTDPVHPKGTEFAVGDYFLAKNGEPVDVDDETAERFKQVEGQTMKQSLSKAFEVEATKSEKFKPEEGSTDSKPEVVEPTEVETLVDEISLETTGGEN